MNLQNDSPDLTIDDIQQLPDEAFDQMFEDPTKRAPRDVAADRAAHGNSAVNTGAYAAGLQDHQAMLQAGRNNRRQAQLMAQAALYPDRRDEFLDQLLKEHAQPDQPGSINISGDHHYRVIADASRDTLGKEAPVQQSQPQQPQNNNSSILPWVLSALMGGATIGGAIIHFSQPSSPDTDTTERTVLDIGKGRYTDTPD